MHSGHPGRGPVARPDISSPPIWPNPNPNSTASLRCLAMTMHTVSSVTCAVACQQKLGSAQSSGIAGHSGRGSTANSPPLWSNTDFQLLARLLTKSLATPSQSAMATPWQEANQSPTRTVVGTGAGVPVGIAGGDRLAAAVSVGVGVMLGGGGGVMQAVRARARAARVTRDTSTRKVSAAVACPPLGFSESGQRVSRRGRRLGLRRLGGRRWTRWG